MTHQSRQTADSRPLRIRRLIKEALIRHAAGDPASVSELTDKHPELMPELAVELEKLQVVLIASDRANRERNVEADANRTRPRGRLKIHCPHCHTLIELIAEASFRDVVCSSCGSRFNLVEDRLSPSRPSTGDKVGHFVLIEQVGAGGFGTVWRAQDSKLERTVAVKIPRRGQLEPNEIEQFLHEARMAAQLNHPYIASVHQVGRDNEIVYIVSDYVSGISLADRIAAGQRFSFLQSAELCQKIADALVHAHELGIIHCDLKPQNVVIDLHGQPHLLDFGLARRDTGEITMTVEGKIIGTPAYMSPEQARGEVHQSDARSDVYSLGVILFELLTGEVPFRGNLRMVTHQLAHDEPPRPRALNNAVPRDLETVCLKCLEKAPSSRYQTAMALRDDLQRFLSSQPVHARPMTSLGRTWRWCQRNPVVSMLTAVVIGLLVTFAVAGPLVGIRQISLRGAAERAHQRTAEEFRRNRRLVYALEMRAAQSALTAGNVSRARQLLDGHQPQPDVPDMRGVEWYYLQSVCQSLEDRGRPIRHDGPVYEVLFSPDGSLLATMEQAGTLKLWNTDSGTLNSELPMKDIHGGACIAFSPDRTMLAASPGGDGDHACQIVVWDLTTGQQVKVLSKHTGPVWALAFSPDGAFLGSGSEDESVILWNVHDGTHRKLPIRYDEGVGCVAFSPDGKTLAVPMAKGPHIDLWDLRSTEKTARIPGRGFASFSADGNLLAVVERRGVAIWKRTNGRWAKSGSINARGVIRMAFSPHENILATGGHDNTVRLWNANGQLLETFHHAGNVYAVSFSPDGRTLASCSFDRTATRWQLSRRRKTSLAQDDGRWFDTMAISSDGQMVATKTPENEIILWNTNTLETIWTVQAHEDRIRSLAFAPDSRTLASASYDRTVKLWSTTDGSLKQTFEGHTDYVWCVAFSPNGRLLASGARGHELILRDLFTGSHWNLKGASVDTLSMAFTADGTTLVAGGGRWHGVGEVKLWCVATRQLISTLSKHLDIVFDVDLSPDGALLASAGRDDTVRLWDMGTRTFVATLDGHTGAVHSVVFSLDGRTLASAGDHTIRLWHMPTHQEMVKLDTGVVRIAFLPNRKALISTDGRGAVVLWDGHSSFGIP